VSRRDLDDAWSVLPQGALPRVDGSVAKLQITRAFVRAAAELLDRLGTDCLVPRGQPGAVPDGLVEQPFVTRSSRRSTAVPARRHRESTRRTGPARIECP
jgi:hypothetical protein